MTIMMKPTSIWFIAGVTLAVFMMASKCCGKKFDTPIDFALPDACTSSIAFQASWSFTSSLPPSAKNGEWMR